MLIFKTLRKKIYSKPISLISAGTILFQLVYPTIALGLTAGPSQPEVQSFEPVSTTQMVDPFTGDFTYNIPLLDCGGYPINLSYHAGIGMDQEASWVGLGWNINPGVINRNMRGLPDDFKGDEIEKKTNMKQFVQVGIDPRFKNNLKKDKEVFGVSYYFGNNYYQNTAEKITFLNDKLNYQIYYNNYKGVGYSISANLPTNRDGNNSKEFQGNLGLGYDSQEGLTIAPSLNYKRKGRKNMAGDSRIKGSLSTSIGYSSRTGLVSLGIGKGLSRTQTLLTNRNGQRNKNHGTNSNSSYNFQNVSYTPTSRPNQFTYNYSINFKYYNDRSASTSPQSELNTKVNAEVAVNGIHNVTNNYKSYGYLNEQFKDKEALGDFNSEDNITFNKYTNNLSPSSNTYDILSLSGQGTGGSYKPNKNYYSILAEPTTKINNISKISLPFELGITQPKTKTPFVWKTPITSLFGKSVKIGADPTLTYVWGSSGIWDEKSGNKALENLDVYRREQTVNTLNEKVYYKNASEKTVYDVNYLTKVSDAYPLSIDINANFKNANIFDDYNTTSKYVTPKGEKDFSDGLDKKGRAKRSEVINYLNAKEASNFGLNKSLNSYSYNTINKAFIKGQNISRADANIRKEHHISEITSTTVNGARYVYGLPVYNTEQIEYSFNVGEKNMVESYFKHGITTYDKNNNTDDRSIDNKKGVDHFFHQEKMPPYAHSWMLTAVLSSDYVDVTGDGPTSDDLGSYTKFNYEKLYSYNPNDLSGLYSWRSPTGLYSAHHNRGLKSDYTDDKGSIVSGKKEIWYLQSIETKTHIALFILSERNDGLSVNSTGSINYDMRMKKLDRIELFNLNEFTSNINQSKIPIKTVNFEYSYDLCPNTLNNDNQSNLVNHPLSSYNSALYSGNSNQNKGKLTLHKVWFTYGKNPKGALSPYIFEYKGINPEYASKSMDRWGNYKPWNYHNAIGSYNDDKISNAENPYVPQNESLVDAWAGAWNLTNIKLPSGGKLNIEYESDDYAFVQDKKASQMYKILALGRTSTLPGGVLNNIQKVYDKDNNFDVNNYIFFECPQNATKEDVIGNLNSIYGSFYTHLNVFDVPIGMNQRKDHIQGYMDIEDAGVSNGIGYIKVKPSFLGDKDNNSIKDNIHPMTKQAFQFIREQASFLAYPGYTQKSDDKASSIVGSLYSFIPEFVRTIFGHEHYMRERNYASSIDLNNSYIKLYNSNGAKKGGGHRVKKITINDNWGALTNNNENEFLTGQEFDYSSNEKEGDLNSRKISSGVASWEPIVGGDENTHRERIRFETGSNTMEEKRAFAPNNFRYEEGPIGESFFPAAVIGYSKITIKNIKPNSIDPDLLKKHGTGITVQEFYTAKDFPTITNRTRLDVYIRKNLALGILGISKEKATASQGFSIELNDMHGKPKSVKNYSEFDFSKVINGTEYHYKVDDQNITTKHLNNNVKVLNNKGEFIDNQPVGIEVELFSNAQSSEHNALTGATAINLNVIFPNSQTPPLFPVVSVVPSMSYSRSVVNIITTTKVINRFGLLEKINVIEDGATLSTENLAWDAENGEVIYSKTKNEYGDYDFNITKPAHWVEAGMSGAYQNIGAELLLKTTSNTNPGEVIFSTAGQYGLTTENINNLLFPGDELIPTLPDNPDQFIEDIYDINGNKIQTIYFKDIIANSIFTKKFWVLSTSSSTANLIDVDGNPLPFDNKPYYFKIIRSGHRNLLTAPAEQMTSKVEFPNNWATTSTFNNILNGSALLYSDKWQTYFKPPISAKINCELGTMDITEPLIENNNGTIPASPTLRDFADIDFSGNSNWQNYSFCNDVTLPGGYANPYILGIRGNWRPWYSLIYYDRTNANTERNQNKINSGDANTTDTRTAGTISNYVPFYQYATNTNSWTPQWLPGNNIHNQWIWQNRATLIGPNSEELENENVMNIYSSALFGYQKKLPIAVVGNAKYQDIMFDGFEEYNTGFFTAKCPTPGNTKAEFKGYPEPNIGIENMICENLWHWPLWKGLANGKGRITTQNAHTGKHSLMITTSAKIPLDNNDLLTGTNTISNGKFLLSASDFIPVFSPKNTSNVNSEYLISYWTYGSGTIEAKDALGNALSINQIGTPIIIDGWKRFEGKITLMQGQKINELNFVNNNSPTGNNPVNPLIPVLFDDLRILPFMGNMNSYVYDNSNLRLMATLGENNFATFYEYDEEGSLIRTKIETEKGIMTVQESRSSLRKK